MATHAQEIVDQLNRIEEDAPNPPGQNSAEVWEYILTLDDFDEGSGITQASSSDRFALTDGTVIRWDGQRGMWYS